MAVMDVAAIISNVRKSWIVFVMLALIVFLWPIILLAHLNAFVGQNWYWCMYYLFFERFFLLENDHSMRVKLFEPLADECRKKESSGSSLKVLEIGPGTGGNFGYYPSGLKLTTLELNPRLQEHVDAIKSKFPNLTIEKIVIGNAENMSMFADNSFDAVIGTHILCCIRNKEAAVREIHRVLKTGGKFYALELVGSSKKETLKRLGQKLVAPFWSFFTLGCTGGNFDALVLLSKAGFDVSPLTEFEHPDGPYTHSNNLFGHAVKKPL